MKCKEHRMIVRWKNNAGSAEYVGQWQGLGLTIAPVDGVRRKWAVAVDGERCRQRWYTPTAAMNEIDAAMERVVIAEATRGVHAQQRPLSAERIVRHA